MATIEELLKQAKFRNERHKSIMSILYCSNLIDTFYNELFGKFDLTLQQYNVLRILRGQYPNPSTINLIRERMLDRMSDASRIVERLRKAGLVERVQCEADRRAVDVVITKKGLGILAQIDKYETTMDKPGEKLGDKDAKQLNELLQRVLDSMI